MYQFSACNICPASGNLAVLRLIEFEESGDKYKSSREAEFRIINSDLDVHTKTTEN